MTDQVSTLCAKLNEKGYVVYRYPVKKQVCVSGSKYMSYSEFITYANSIL